MGNLCDLNKWQKMIKLDKITYATVQVLDLHTASQVNEPLPSMTSALQKPSFIITYRNSNTLPSIIQLQTQTFTILFFPMHSILNLPHTNPLFTLVLVTPFIYSCNVVLSSIITVVKVKVIFSLSQLSLYSNSSSARSLLPRQQRSLSCYLVQLVFQSLQQLVSRIVSRQTELQQ